MDDKTIEFTYAMRGKRILKFFPIVILTIAIEIGLYLIPAVRQYAILTGLVFALGCGIILVFGYKFFSSFSKSDKFLKRGKFSFKNDKVVVRYDNKDETFNYADIKSLGGVIKSELGIRYSKLTLHIENHKKIVFKSEDTLKFNFKETEYFTIIKEFAKRSPATKLLNIKDYGKIKDYVKRG